MSILRSVIGCAFGLGLALALTPGAIAGTVVVEAFETYPTTSFPSGGGWFIHPGASGAGASAQIVTNIEAYSGTQSMMLVSTGGLGVYVDRTYIPTGDLVMIEAMVNTTRTDASNAFIGFGGISGGLNYALAALYPGGIVVAANDGMGNADALPVGSYVADEWTKLAVVVDLNANTYDIYINDVLAMEDIAGAAVPGGTDAIDRIVFGVFNSLAPGSGGGGTTAFFDNIIVTEFFKSEVPEPIGLLLFVPGLLVFGLLKRKHRKQRYTSISISH